jgi:hypothetical protein
MKFAQKLNQAADDENAEAFVDFCQDLSHQAVAMTLRAIVYTADPGLIARYCTGEQVMDLADFVYVISREAGLRPGETQ